jgi:spore germination cell wall hydrolase CwlJ-like protein
MTLNYKTITVTLIVFLLLVLTHSNLYTPEVQKIEPIEVKELVHIDPKQLACLAKNIYYEAGSESLLGQAAVARVVMNRVKHGFGKNPCQVIYQTTTVKKVDSDGELIKTKLCQFSWVCEDKGILNKNSPRYKQAEKIAYDVLANDAYANVVPKSTLFFHNLTVDPAWPYKQVAKIGNHIFYSREKKQKNDSGT